MWAKLTAPPEAPGDGEPSSGSVPPGTHTWAHHGLHMSPKLRSVEELAPVAAGLVPNSPPTGGGPGGTTLHGHSWDSAFESHASFTPLLVIHAHLLYS